MYKMARERFGVTKQAVPEFYEVEDSST